MDENTDKKERSDDRRDDDDVESQLRRIDDRLDAHSIALRVHSEAIVGGGDAPGRIVARVDP